MTIHPTRPLVMARNGMASTGHPLASQAAIDCLKAGGNAMDAAITASAVLAVVDPAASGVGGDIFYTYFDAASGKLDSLVGSGLSGAEASLDSFDGAIPSFGPKVATVPGIVQGWEDALRLHGTRSLADCLAPAIAYARDGFPVSPRVAGAFQRKSAMLEQCATVREAFQIEGRWPLRGETLRQPDLARSLDLIAEHGAEVFYRGELARLIADAQDEAGGLLNADDLAAHVSLIDEPLLGRYRGYEVAVQQPPTMGAILLLQLKLVERLSDGTLPWGSAEWLHLLIEAKKASFADLEAYLTDPGFTTVAPARYLDDAHIARRIGDISTTNAASYDPSPVGAGLSDTTYLTIADDKGNVISMIQSVFNEFGSCWMAPGTGFLMNNRTYGFSSVRGHINQLEPKKRTAHTLLAPIVLKDGKPVLALGTPGDYGQTQSNLQMITNFIDYGMDAQAIIDAPRWRSLEGMEVALEDRFGSETVAALTKRGHQMRVAAPWTDLMGGAQAIAINPRTGCLEGAADARREGYAIGW